MEIENKLKALMAVILAINEGSISNRTSMDTVKSWDSLKHMNLIMAIERDFDVELDDDEISEMQSVEVILEVLKEKLI